MFIRITPFMHVPDINQAVAFFRRPARLQGLHPLQRLRLRSSANVPECEYYRIMETTARLPATADSPTTLMSMMWTKLYAELKPKLDTLPKADVHGPADKPYGQRELAILAPDGNLLVFGHSIKERGNS